MFARDGFHATTIPDIAEAADVAPRTVSTYFPSKEGIVFEEYEAAIERFAARLAHRPEDMPVHVVMREWLLSEDEHQQGPTRGLVRPSDNDDADFARLRETAIVSDPDLWALQRRYMLPVVGLVAHGLAKDLGIEPDSLQARIVGDATVATLLAVNARAARMGTAAMDEFDAALEFLRSRLMTEAIE